VDPPSTTARSARFCLSARAMATGSTPTCDQKRRSSAAIRAATSVGGSLPASIRVLRVPSPDSASYSGTPRRSTTTVDVVAGSSSRWAGGGTTAERHAAAIDDTGGRRGVFVEQIGGDGTKTDPEARRDDSGSDQNRNRSTVVTRPTGSHVHYTARERRLSS